MRRNWGQAWTPRWHAQDPARLLGVDGGGRLLMDPKRGPTPKCPLPFSPLLPTLNQPPTLWARPVQGSTDESNSVSKLN